MDDFLASDSEAYAQHEQASHQPHTPSLNEDSLFRPEHAQHMQRQNRAQAFDPPTQDSPNSLATFEELSITPEQERHMPNISVGDAVANWLNAADSDDSDSEEGAEAAPIYGRTLGLNEIPYMGFNPESIAAFGLIISSNHRTTISVEEVYDVLATPEYPITALNGAATFVHFTGRFIPEPVNEQSIRGAFGRIKNQIQFDIGRPTNGSLKFNTTHLKFLGQHQEDTKFYHMQYRCSGIRMCGYADKDMLGMRPEYDRVNIRHIEDFQRNLGQRNFDHTIHIQVKKYTENMYQAFKKGWARAGLYPCYNAGLRLMSKANNSCRGQEMKMFKKNETYFIGCPRNSAAEPWHTATSLSTFGSRADLRYLEALCQSGIRLPQEKCVWIGHTGQRRNNCGHDHPTGPTNTQLHPCSVLFDIYIPFNSDRFSYFIIVCRGSHTHHPPLPHKTPQEILADIKSALGSEDTLGLTTRQFLLSPQFNAIKRRYGDITLRTIHASLNLEDRLTLMIRKQRLVQYPLGCAFAGAMREFQQQQLLDKSDRWIQHICYLEEGHWIIICCTYAQATRFLNQRYIEIDLSFKMVAGKVTLFSIAGWDQETQRTDTYIYAFTNATGHTLYSNLFHQLFSTIENLTGNLVLWRHIHGSGICTVIADMDGAQAKGLGQFLHMLDNSRTWTEHLQHQLIFCQVHIRRNFRKQFPIHPAQHMLHHLFEATTCKDYLERIQGFIAVHPELRSWFKAKQKPWIISAIAKGASKIPSMHWVYARKNSNLAEVSHFEENNACGRKLALLTGILRLRKHIQDKDEKREIELTTGQPPSWRNKSVQARLYSQITANELYNRSQAERRRQDPRRPFNPLNPFDTEDVSSQHMPGISEAHSEASLETGITLPSMRPTALEIRSSPSSAYAEHTPSISTQRKRRGTNSTLAQENAAHAQKMQRLQQRRIELLAEKHRREVQAEEEAICALEESLGIRP